MMATTILMLVMTMMTMMTMTAEGSNDRYSDYVTHDYLDQRLWELKSFLLKLGEFTHYKTDSYPFGYLSSAPPHYRKGGYESSYAYGKKRHGYGGSHYDKYPKGHGYYKGYGKKPYYGLEYFGIHCKSCKKGSYGNDYGGVYYVAFMGKAGNGKSVYDLYTCGGHNDTYESRQYCGCITLSHGYQNPSCGYDHYKSRIIDDWKYLHIDKVRVSIYEHGKEKAYFVFDGKDSSSTDFFSQDRLKCTSYDDLDSDTDTNYFSIKGHVSRRFFINKEYGGNCKKDKGWLAVIDCANDDDDCDWTDVDDYPAFLYSSEDEYQTWHDGEVKEGDLLVISVKLGGYGSHLPYTDVDKCHYHKSKW